MMRHLNINLSVTCKKDEILKALKENRDQHRKLVNEAREGYVKRAKEELQAKLDKLASGKITSLVFALKVPVDFTPVYETTIHMLESHTGDTITLNADEYRHLVEDEWEWTREFVGSNAAYSGSTRAWSASKGFEIE